MINSHPQTDFAHPEEINTFLSAHPEISLFEIFLVDPNGVLRGKWLKREEVAAIYQEGRPLPASIHSLNTLGEDVVETGLIWDVADCDCRAYPIANSIRIQPWRSLPTASIQIMMHPTEGMPAYSGDPRGVLLNLLQRLAIDDLIPDIAIEYEFYIIDPTKKLASQKGTPFYAPLDELNQVYDLNGINNNEKFFTDIYRSCEEQRLPVRTAISEYGPGQLEITLEHQANALLAVDQAIALKHLIKQVARKYNYLATFMAKPFSELSGSGMHQHISLVDTHHQNLFASERPSGSELMHHAIAGILQHAQECVAIFCPTGNSYKRFQSLSYAPTHNNWGVNNRTVSVRIPTGSSQSRHLEHRICGADANPYITLAATLACMYQGIQLKLQLPPEQKGNAYDDASCPTLSFQWQEALDHFSKSTLLESMLGESFHSIYHKIKTQECKSYNSQVTQLDHGWYFNI
ncbi:MAG: glutamine synthetase family protein [Methylacidiphilales bacterium]|nr:glutamine synthetase family protein [Candidatus Methylacidiphilales bacterium]